MLPEHWVHRLCQVGAAFQRSSAEERSSVWVARIARRFMHEYYTFGGLICYFSSSLSSPDMSFQKALSLERLMGEMKYLKSPYRL